MKETITYIRFKEFLADVKKAKTDEEILMAGHALLEKWRGYKSSKVSDAGLKAIKQLINP